MRWIKHDRTGDRNKYLGQLLQYVRLPLMTRSYLLQQVSEDPLIQNNQHGKDLLIEAMKYHLRWVTQSSQWRTRRISQECANRKHLYLCCSGYDYSPEQRTGMSSLRTRPRQPENLHTYIVSVGGGSLFAIHNECEAYDPKSDRWTSLAPTSQRRSRAGVVVLNRQIYALGGYNGTKDLSSGECYDPLCDTWVPITPMGTKRSCLGVSIWCLIWGPTPTYTGTISDLILKVEHIDKWSLHILEEDHKNPRACAHQEKGLGQAT